MTQEPQPRLTAEEWLKGKGLGDPESYTFKAICKQLKQFARQEVEAKDREWRERISEEITVLQGGNEKLPEESAARMCNDWAIWKLENLLKRE